MTTFTAAAVHPTNHRNFNVFANGRKVGVINVDTYSVVKGPQFGFVSASPELANTGWKFNSLAECLAAVGR